MRASRNQKFSKSLPSLTTSSVTTNTRLDGTLRARPPGEPDRRQSVEPGEVMPFVRRVRVLKQLAQEVREGRRRAPRAASGHDAGLREPPTQDLFSQADAPPAGEKPKSTRKPKAKASPAAALDWAVSGPVEKSAGAGVPAGHAVVSLRVLEHVLDALGQLRTVDGKRLSKAEQAALTCVRRLLTHCVELMPPAERDEAERVMCEECQEDAPRVAKTSAPKHEEDERWETENWPTVKEPKGGLLTEEEEQELAEEAEEVARSAEEGAPKRKAVKRDPGCERCPSVHGSGVQCVGAKGHYGAEHGDSKGLAWEDSEPEAAQHTPGPWRWSDADDDGRSKRCAIRVVGQEGVTVATLTYDRDDVEGREAARADVALVAAAPKLKDVLVRAVEFLERVRKVSKDAHVTEEAGSIRLRMLEALRAAGVQP